MDANQQIDVLEPFERLIPIIISGQTFMVPENNSILRCLQYLEMEKISNADLCWNGECVNCQVWIKNGPKEKPAMACRTTVSEGMEILRLAATLL